MEVCMKMNRICVVALQPLGQDHKVHVSLLFEIKVSLDASHLDPMFLCCFVFFKNAVIVLYIVTEVVKEKLIWLVFTHQKPVLHTNSVYLKAWEDVLSFKTDTDVWAYISQEISLIELSFLYETSKQVSESAVK